MIVSKVNRYKDMFSNTSTPFESAPIAEANCLVGQCARKVRLRLGRVDRTNSNRTEKSMYIFAKRNIEAVRR